MCLWKAVETKFGLHLSAEDKTFFGIHFCFGFLAVHKWPIYNYSQQKADDLQIRANARQQSLQRLNDLPTCLRLVS